MAGTDVITDVYGRGSVCRRVVQIGHSEHVERNRAETLQDHRHYERRQVLAAGVHVGVSAPASRMYAAASVSLSIEYLLNNT